MDLVVDSFIYKYQRYGGISRIFSETLPRMCDIRPDLETTILIGPDVSLERLPKHARINYKIIPEPGYYFRPYRLWKPYYPRLRQWGGRLLTGSSKNKIWLSTYYTSPSFWRGRRVVVAYDFIHERFKLEHWLDDMDNVDTVIADKAKAIANADLVICISETTKTDLMTYYPMYSKRTSVVHLAPSAVFRQLNTVIAPDRKFILYVGRRNRYKGFSACLNAFCQWHRNQELDLVCVGGGDWAKSEEEQIIRLRLQDKVKLLPRVNDQKLCELYNQAEIFIYPSEYEGFGIPLLEAMACGCLVVASRIPSTVEIAQHVPFYFTPGNTDELTNALEQAFCDGQARKRKESGLSLASLYSWDKTAQEILSSISGLPVL